MRSPESLRQRQHNQQHLGIVDPLRQPTDQHYDPSEPQNEVGKHRVIVKPLREKDLRPQELFALVFWPEQPPIHVEVPSVTVESADNANRNKD